jgi:hypothetical protein
LHCWWRLRSPRHLHWCSLGCSIKKIKNFYFIASCTRRPFFAQILQLVFSQ